MANAFWSWKYNNRNRDIKKPSPVSQRRKRSATSDSDENIDVVDEEEKTIMNKHALDGQVVRAGPDKGGVNNFELPDKEVQIASVDA